MKKTSRKNAGFTLLEVMMASVILLIALESLFSVFFTAQYLVMHGRDTITLQAGGQIGMEKMERYLRMGITPTVLAGGDQINFTFDTSANPDSPTLVTRSIYFVNVDGDETTANDNYFVYDPDTSTVGGEDIFMEDVRRPPSAPFFAVSGKVVTVNVRLYTTMPSYDNAVTLDYATTVRMRN